MNRWKIALFVSLALLVLSNGFWLYAVIDQAISYDYLKVSYDNKSQAVEDLGNLVVQGSTNYTKADLLYLLRQAKPDAFIVDEGDRIIFEQMRFRFADGKLVAVEQ